MTLFKSWENFLLNCFENLWSALYMSEGSGNRRTSNRYLVLDLPSLH